MGECGNDLILGGGPVFYDDFRNANASFKQFSVEKIFMESHKSFFRSMYMAPGLLYCFSVYGAILCFKDRFCTVCVFLKRSGSGKYRGDVVYDCLSGGIVAVSDYVQFV